MLLIALILFLARSELVYAWGLLGKINLGKLVWMLPIIAAGYLATGEMIFSYLRQKGFVKNINPATLARISLELNFVNHAFPSGGVSGISYANWRLGKYGANWAGDDGAICALCGGFYGDCGLFGSFCFDGDD